MMPRWVPKKVLWVDPVTMSAPSTNGCWKCGPTRPRTCAMSYMSTASTSASSRNVRTSYTGSGCSTMLLPRIMSSGRSFSITSRSAGTSALYGLSQHRDVDYRGHLGARVAGDVVAQGAHGLRAQVTAARDVVVEHLADAARLRFAVGAVEVVHERTEHGRVGHLAADDARLHLGAAEVRAQFVDKQALDFVDEPGPLVVEDLEVVEGLRLLVLGVPEGRVGDGQQTGHRRRRHLARDQVDALVLTPDVVPDGAGEQPQGLLAGFAALELS